MPKISELPAAVSLNLTDEFPLDNAGVTSKATLTLVRSAIIATLSPGTYTAATITVGSDGRISGVSSSANPIPFIITDTQSVDLPNVPTGTEVDHTVTVAGAEVGDPVVVGLPAAFPAGLTLLSFVSAADTVTLRLYNPTGADINPSVGSFTFKVFS